MKNYPPSPIHSNQTDSAWHFPYKGEPLMETNQDELKAHLMATNEEFRALATQHCQYHKELELLEEPAVVPNPCMRSFCGNATTVSQLFP